MPMTETPDALFAKLVPEARAAAEKLTDAGLAPLSALGEASQRWWRIEHVDGVLVQRQRGGWSSDVILTGVPPGVSNMMGTRVEEPLATREDALAYAVQMLTMFIVNSRKPVPPDPEEATFLYHGHPITLPLDMLAALTAVAPKDDRRGVATLRLQELDRDLLPIEEGRELDRKTQVRLMTAAAMALVAGVLRWPEREAPPERH